MKTRSGFVSNSSSSSFIVRAGGAYKTVFDLALHMLKRRGEEWGDEPEASAIVKTPLDHDTPTAFRTCNYDTFIMRSGDRFLVGTCNNHDFELRDTLPLVLTDEELKLLGMDCNDLGSVYEELESNLKKVTKFWWPELNVMMKIPKRSRLGSEYGHCKLCQARLVSVSELGRVVDEVLCPKCRFGLWV